MAISSSLIMMVRVLINDTESPQTYSDSRLEQVIVVGATYVQQEIDFTTTYTINITSPDITPDPTATATKDDAFTNFVALKSACMVDVSTFRTKAAIAGLKARCTSSVQIDTLQHLTGFKELLNSGPCAAYEELKKQYQFGNNIVKGILSPFVSNDFDPMNLPGGAPSRSNRHFS